MNFPSNQIMMQAARNPALRNALDGFQEINPRRFNGIDFFDFTYENSTTWLGGFITGDDHGLVALVANHFMVSPDQDKDVWRGKFHPNEELNISIAAADDALLLFKRVAGLDNSPIAPNLSVMRMLYKIGPYMGKQIPVMLKDRKLNQAVCWREKKDFPQLMKAMGARKSTRKKTKVYLWSAAK